MNETAKNITPVYFNGSREAFLEEEEGLVQYDYGQILKFEDIELPSAYTVHFGNEKEDGLSKPMIGDEDGVEIPAEFLQTGLPVWAWIFLHEGEDDGETEYIVKIPVRRRSRPTNYAPTEVQQSAIDQAIAALNVAVEETEESAQAAAADALKAEGYAVGKQGGQDVGSGSPYYHNNAAYFAGEASGSATAAGTAQTAAETAQGKAEQAQGKAEQAQGKAETAQEKAETAQGKAEAAEEEAERVVGGALDDITEAKNLAVGAVQDEGTTQVGAVQSEGTTQKGAVQGEGTTQIAAVQHEGQVQTAAAAAEALKSEGYALGKQGGQDVGSGSPYYHNNAAYYSGEAAASAAAAAAATAAKADKVSGATAGHVAALDASGNLTDAGNKYNPVPKDETMPLRVGVDSDGKLWAAGDSGAERFGVRGVGGSSTALTRLWDATGLTATAGTDQTAAASDFDRFAVFNRKKCVGSWTIVDGAPVFTVAAYEGDADYAEDGTMGDYVAVDVPPTYWYHDETDGILGVSGGMHPGWEPHPVCLDKDGNVREHTFLPVYPLSKDGDGHAVSLPGFDPFFGCYKDVWDAAKTYGDGSSFANYAIIEPSVVDHYEWLMMTVEFATTNMQTVMAGATSMAYNTNHKITAAPAANKIVLTAAIGNLFLIGQTIYIGAGHGDTPSGGVSAYNHITAIENCDADGTLNPSGTYRLVTYDGTDRTSSITADTTKIGSRPWISGATNGAVTGIAAVLGHTGSPISNSSGQYPMRYRWRENVYGNINITALDLFDARTADGDSYHLDWYYNDRLRYEGPSLYYPSSTSKPDLTDLQTAANGFRKLTTTTPKTSYADGYIKEEGFDADLPCIRVPTLTSGGSATTYYADYAALASSAAVRAVRRRGHVTYGAYAGPRYVNAYYAPSNGTWLYGAALYMLQ